MRLSTLRRRFARDAERMMVDVCRIERPGEVVTDPETGVVSPSFELVYEGPCKVQQTLAQSSSQESGGAMFTVQDSRLDIPVGAGPVAPGDRATMLTGVYNPALVGNVYRVTDLYEKSLQTAQRLRVEELL